MSYINSLKCICAHVADSGDPWFASVSRDVTKANGFPLASSRAPATQRGRVRKETKWNRRRKKNTESSEALEFAARLDYQDTGYHHFRLHPIPLGCFSL